MGNINPVPPVPANTSPPTSSATDYLNDWGVAVLTMDTRWVIIFAILFVAIFWVILRQKRNRWMPRDQVATLSLALLQLYSAPVIFSMLVLTEPPRIDLVGKFQRQGVGLLAFIFLVAGVVMQIVKFWTDEPKPEMEKPKANADNQNQNKSPQPNGPDKR